jgi:hypothetical protein
MHFDTKSYLKNTRNHTAKQALSRCFEQAPSPISYRSLIDRYSFKGKCSVKKQSPFLGYLFGL